MLLSSGFLKGFQVTFINVNFMMAVVFKEYLEIQRIVKILFAVCLSY